MDSSNKTIKTERTNAALSWTQTRIWLDLSRKEMCNRASDDSLSYPRWPHIHVCFKSSHSTKRPFCCCWWHRHANIWRRLDTEWVQGSLCLLILKKMKLMWTLGTTSVRLNTPLYIHLTAGGLFLYSTLAFIPSTAACAALYIPSAPTSLRGERGVGLFWHWFLGHLCVWNALTLYLFCMLIISGSRSNDAVAKQSKQRSGILKRNEEFTSSVFHFIWICFCCLKLSHSIYHMSSRATKLYTSTKALARYITLCLWHRMALGAMAFESPRGWYSGTV